MSDLDLSGLDDVVTPTDDQLRTIQQLAKRQLTAERTVSELEGALREAKQNLTNINENLLPDAMLAIGFETFRLVDGTEIDVKESVFASISVKNQPEAYRWLKANNHGAIIRNALTSTFGPGEEELSDKAKDLLTEAEIGFESKSSIHPGTLRAWVNEQLANSNEVPESISYYEKRVSKGSGFEIPEEGIDLEDVERMLIVQALERTDWVQKSAAKLLGISPRVINYKISKHDIKGGK